MCAPVPAGVARPYHESQTRPMVTLTTRQDLELRRLRQAFAAQLPDRVHAIETALSEMQAAGAADDERLDALFHLAHRLCGSAGIYGYQEVHLAAAALECAAQSLRGAQAGSLDDLRRLFDALERVSAGAPGAARRRRSRPPTSGPR